MSLIRSLIFYFLIGLTAVIIVTFFLPVFLIKNRKFKIADYGAKIWTYLVMWLLRILCNVKYEIRGLENLPKNQGFIIASKHQSMWETVIMHLIFHRPAYAYKKELLAVPFYGWFLNKMSGVTVDRKGGAKALKDLLNESKNYLNKGQVIVIFPQGTRTPIGANVEDYPYQAGITALYSKLNVPVVPTALNSGLCWNKQDFRIKSGKIVIEFLPAISAGLDKKEFLPKLEKAIEQKSEELAQS